MTIGLTQEVQYQRPLFHDSREHGVRAWWDCVSGAYAAMFAGVITLPFHRSPPCERARNAPPRRWHTPRKASPLASITHAPGRGTGAGTSRTEN